MLDLAQLLRVPQVDAAFDIAPDGSRAAFAWNKTGDWQLYEIFLDFGKYPTSNEKHRSKILPPIFP